ncbi:hypothetical protein HDU98_006163 [Podochytrium sp. JEL0797]|nr:hypothetical protein HDU98_006163 [Podochytrium sp. JEL0797]
MADTEPAPLASSVSKAKKSTSRKGKKEPKTKKDSSLAEAVESQERPVIDAVAVQSQAGSTESLGDKKGKKKKDKKKRSSESITVQEESVLPMSEPVIAPVIPLLPLAPAKEVLVAPTPNPVLSLDPIEPGIEPIAEIAPQKAKPKSKTKKPSIPVQEDEDNVPLANLSPAEPVEPVAVETKKKKKKSPKPTKRVSIKLDEESEHDEPAVIPKPSSKKSPRVNSKKGKKLASESESDPTPTDSNSASDTEPIQTISPRPTLRSYLPTSPIKPSPKPTPISTFNNDSETTTTDSDAYLNSSDSSDSEPVNTPRGSARTPTTPLKSFFGTLSTAISSILEADQTPEEKAKQKQRKATDEAIKRQMENNAKFAVMREVIPGLLHVTRSPSGTELGTGLVEPVAVVEEKPEPTSLNAVSKPHVVRVPGMPMAPAPDSEREFSIGLGWYNRADYAQAITHFERAVKIDDNAESLRMLIQVHHPSRVPNAGKVAEYTAKRNAVLATSQGMLNHGRHLARMGGKGFDGPGIVLVRGAADMGSAEAMYEFGMYLRGKGKGGEAMGWLHQSAEAGWVDAEEAVAEGYEQGLGVPIDTIAGAAWRTRVNNRLKTLAREQEASTATSQTLAAQLRKDAQKRESERALVQQSIQQREANLVKRRAVDPALNSALRSLEWGFYSSAIEQLANLATAGCVDAKEFMDPDLSLLSPKAATAMFYMGQYCSSQADPKGAVKWFRKSAEAGYHEGMVTLAAYLIIGKGLESADPGQAMAWLMKSWDTASNKEAALALGEAYTKGVGVSPDPTKAVKWYTRAWEAGGYSEAAFAIGLACATGFTPGAVDPAVWASTGAGGKRGVNEVLGRISEGGGEGKGKAVIKADAIPSVVQAQEATPSSLGTQLSVPAPKNTLNSPLLKNFSAYKQDVVQAAQWYKKASDLGHSRACNNLGELLMTGRGITRNDVNGFALFRRAAMAGLPEAEYNMGRCCREGRGCGKSEEQAVMWFKRAEGQGIREATKALVDGEKGGK